ncbi:MAG: hypothetical protein HOP11_12640 [Saprospiraceae bacterium]|nr:hypothetical protein [Saprospiraceae bacterium]
MKSILIFVFTIWIISSLHSQYSVVVVTPQTMALKSLPLWNCIIQNNSNSPTRMYLVGMISELKAGRLGEVKSADFILPVGMTQFNTNNYSALQPEQVIFKNQKYEDHIVRTNQLPNGKYTICISVYSAQTSKLVANNCTQVTVNQVTPPILMSPSDRKEICEPNPVFTWIPIRGFIDDSRLSYKLHIVEILNQQKALSAIKTNPCYYCQSFIKEPIHQLSIAFQGFKDGARYAWYVGVLDGKKEISRSEVWEFNWKKCLDDNPNTSNEEDEEETTETKNDRKPGIAYFDLNENPNIEIVRIGNKKLNIRNLNLGLPTNVECLFYSQINSFIYQKTLSLSQGINYLTIDLSSVQLTEGEFYIMEMVYPDGKMKQIQFKL